MSRRKWAALAGVLPLGAIAAGSAYFVRSADDAPADPGPGPTVGNAAKFGAVPTQTVPPEGLAPEISKIGSRHIAALHAIHLYMSHASTYDPQTLDEYFAGSVESTTGALRQQLIDTQAATREFFKATNSRSEVVEFNCGLRAITGTTALGVGYVKQSTSSDVTPGAAVSLTAWVVTAEEQPDGRWLMSDARHIST